MGEACMLHGTVAVLATDASRDHSAVMTAIALSETESFYLDIHCLAVETPCPNAVLTGSVIPLIWPDRKAAVECATELERQLQPLVPRHRHDVQFHRQQFQEGMFAGGLEQIRRFSDWIVVAAPCRHIDDPRPSAAMLKAVLVAGGPPIIAVPEGCVEMSSTPDRLALAWNGSREALRAARSTLPMLRRARLVDVVVVDPDIRHGDRSDPGGDLALFLARHGVRVEINVLSRSRPRISDVLKCHASITGAEAMVMGGSGHPRAHETLFGRTTREILNDPPIPVILAR